MIRLYGRSEDDILGRRSLTWGVTNNNSGLQYSTKSVLWFNMPFFYYFGCKGHRFINLPAWWSDGVRCVGCMGIQSTCREYAKAGLCRIPVFPRSRRIVRRLRSHRAEDGANRTTYFCYGKGERSHTNVHLISLLKTNRGIWVGDPGTDIIKCQGNANRSGPNVCRSP